MHIPRMQLKNLKQSVVPGKVIVIYGAQRAGKTTLLREFLKNESEPYIQGFKYKRKRFSDLAGLMIKA